MNKQLLLRDYPQNWEILPLVRFAGSGNTDFVDGPFGSDLKVSDYTKTGVRVLQLQNLGDGLFINKSKIYTSQKKALMLSRCLTYPGDIIIAKMAEPLARAALVPAYEDKYLIVADLIKLRIARDIDPYYLLCFINFSDFRKEAERLSTGTTRTRISLSTLKKISVPKPPIELQKKLGLIFQTIDRTIAKTEALIEKYQQIKAGLMHDLFTRGIGSDGKLRPPCEEAPELYQESAIGWIPKEWEVEILDRLTQRGSGHTPNKSIDSYWNGGLKWVSLADSRKLDNLYIFDTDLEISELGIQNSSAVIHPEGTVIMTRDAGVGKSAIILEPMAVSQHFMAWRCGEGMNNYFLYYWLQYKKRMFENVAMGSTIVTIGLPYFKKLKIAAPILKTEQEGIGEKLRFTDTHIFSLKSDLKKLKYKKSGLMHDLLTGKVSVKVDPDAP